MRIETLTVLVAIALGLIGIACTVAGYPIIGGLVSLACVAAAFKVKSDINTARVRASVIRDLNQMR